MDDQRSQRSENQQDQYSQQQDQQYYDNQQQQQDFDQQSQGSRQQSRQSRQSRQSQQQQNMNQTGQSNMSQQQSQQQQQQQQQEQQQQQFRDSRTSNFSAQQQSQYRQSGMTTQQNQGGQTNYSTQQNNPNFNKSFVSMTQQKQPEKMQQYSQFVRKDNTNYDDVLQESQVIHHKNFEERAVKCKFVTCSNEEHSENKLNQICLDENCKLYLDPVCIECIESQETHKHRDGFRGLKKFYEKVSQSIDQIQKDLFTKNDEHREWFLNTANTFQDLSDKCLEIRRNILFIMKDIYNGEPYDEIKEVKKIFEEVFTSTEEKTFKTKMEELSQLIDYKREVCTIKKAADLRNIQKNLDIYRSRISQELIQIEEKVDVALRSSFTIEYSPLLWLFEKQKTPMSKMIKEIDQGMIFEGSKQVQQIVYSKQFFDRGRHGCKIQMQHFNPKQDHFIIGLCTEVNKNLDLISIKDTPYSCLFDKQLKYQMQSSPLSYNIADTLPQGGTITLQLDMRLNSFEITSQSKNVTYKLQNYYLKGKTLGFFIAWRGSGARFKLLESF